jgi:hypothetical protein
MSENSFDINTVISDAKKVITNPFQFYREMPTTGGLVNPLIFVLVMAVATAIITAVLSFVGLGMAPMMSGGSAMSAIIFFPIMIAIGSFIGAAIMFVIWKLMGSDKDYETAYRCVAYSMAIAPIVAVISIIPYLGGVVKTLWGMYILYAASIETHAIKTQTAKMVLAILAVIGILVGISSERVARSTSAYLDNLSIENIDEMTPEEAGEKMGEFLKGLEKGASD